MEGDGYTGFSPSFAQLEDVCLQALEQCVTAAGAIPRVGTTTNKGKAVEAKLYACLIGSLLLAFRQAEGLTPSAGMCMPRSG